MYKPSKKTQDLLNFLYQWQHEDSYHIYNLNRLYALEFIDDFEKFDLLESYYDYDLSSYFKDEFVAFAVDGAGGYFCFWTYPELQGEPPIIYNDGHGESELLAASFHDFVCRMYYEVNFEGDKKLDGDVFWDLVESYDDANDANIDKEEADLLIAKDRELFKNKIHDITSLLTEDDVKNNLVKTPSFTVKDSQFTVKGLELYILSGKEINGNEDVDKILKHFEAEFTNGVELYDKEILLSGFKANYPNYWKSEKVQDWINFIENLTEKDKKSLFLARIETYINKLKDNDTEEAKLIKTRYEKLYESLKKEIDTMQDRVTLAVAIENDLPEGIHLQNAIKKLFEWIEEQEYILENEHYNILGCITDPNEDSWVYDEDGHEVSLNGTSICFCPQSTLDKDYYKEIYGEKSNQLYVFGRSGGDGSSVAFWVNEVGEQKIIHIGSGSGSTLFCVLAENPVDFIRLISIGYQEICWLDNKEVLLTPPNQTNTEHIIELPNKKLQAWVKDTFDVEIPKTAYEVFPNPAKMDDESSEDAFWNWHENYAKNE